MGTIVKFQPSIDYYYTRGLDLYENDNFIDALKNYREAYRLTEQGSGADYRFVVEMEMAYCYRNIHLSREAMLMFYKSIADGTPDSAFDSILGLLEMFATDGNEDAFRYYTDLALKMGFGHDLALSDDALRIFGQSEYRVEPTNEENMYEMSKKLIETGNFEFAKQLLEVIPESSLIYPEACGKLASLYNASGEYEKALECAGRARGGADGTEALVNSVLALHKLGRTEEYREALDELAGSGDMDILRLSRLIHVMAIVGDRDLVIKFGARLASVAPLKNPMLCYAIALANAGDLREARKTMVLLQALYPYDALVRVYSEQISALKSASDFSLTCELPPQVEGGILSRLNGVLGECAGDRDELRERLADPSMRTGVLMVFQAGNDKSKSIIADVAIDQPFYEQYIRDCLMDPGFPDADKRLLLPIALRRLKKRPVYLTCRDVCRPLFGKAPSRLGARWSEAYYTAYATVALFGYEDFEHEFDIAFDRVHAALGREPSVDKAALAAVIARCSGVVTALRDDQCCIELFDADGKKYFNYLDKATHPRG